MAALGRKHLAILQKKKRTESSIASPKPTGQEQKAANECLEKELHNDKFMTSASSCHAPEKRQDQSYRVDGVS